MRVLAVASAVLVVAGVVLAGPGLGSVDVQDPQDPLRRAATPPKNVPALPPVAEVPGADIERRDLIQRFLPPSPLEGAWQLRRFVRGARAVDDARGYLTLTRSMMQLYIVQGRPPIRVALVQAGARRYRIEGEQLVTTALAGHDNHIDGSIRHEPPGMVERRSFRLSGANLRIEQSADVYMEFVRVE